MKNVIFLDVDGPVIPNRAIIAKTLAREANVKFYGPAAELLAHYEKHPWQADPLSVILLSSLAVKTNSKFVASTTYRENGQTEFMADFQRWGFDPSLMHEDWSTKFLERVIGENERNAEISEWMSRHPEIDRFVTIDDACLDFDTHIQVCLQNGFSIDNYRNAYEILMDAPCPIPRSSRWEACVEFMDAPNSPKQTAIIQRGKNRAEQRKVTLSTRDLTL